MALFLTTCASRLLFHESLTPRRLVVITSCSLGVVVDMWVVRLLMFDSRCPHVLLLQSYSSLWYMHYARQNVYFTALGRKCVCQLHCT